LRFAADLRAWASRSLKRPYGVRRVAACRVPGESRKGSAGRKLRARRSVGEPWKVEIPREHPACAGLNTRAEARDSRKGESPEAGVRRTGRQVRPAGDRGGLTARGFGGCGNAIPPCERGTLRREKSQERCRDEKGSAKLRGEQTVKRVAKPCRRNVAGRGKPCVQWTLGARMR
jgi:hypothetical protein